MWEKLTAYDGIWTELEELILQFLTEPFYILLLGLIGVLEALCIRWRHPVKVLMLEYFVIWCAACRMSRQRQRSNRVAVIRKVPRNEIFALGLLQFIPVLQTKQSIADGCQNTKFRCRPDEQA